MQYIACIMFIHYTYTLNALYLYIYVYKWLVLPTVAQYAWRSGSKSDEAGWLSLRSGSVAAIAWQHCGRAVLRSLRDGPDSRAAARSAPRDGARAFDATRRTPECQLPNIFMHRSRAERSRGRREVRPAVVCPNGAVLQVCRHNAGLPFCVRCSGRSEAGADARPRIHQAYFPARDGGLGAGPSGRVRDAAPRNGLLALPHAPVKARAGGRAAPTPRGEFASEVRPKVCPGLAAVRPQKRWRTHLVAYEDMDGWMDDGVMHDL